MSHQSSSRSRQEILDQLTSLGPQSSGAVVQYHQAAAERFGLNATDMKTLPLLEEGQIVNAGDLARSLGLTTGAVTNVIDRLERAGFVERAPDPEDRRKVVVKLAPKRPEVLKVYQPLAQAMNNLYQSYTDQELTLIADYAQKVIAIMQHETRDLRSQDKTS